MSVKSLIGDMVKSWRGSNVVDESRLNAQAKVAEKIYQVATNASSGKLFFVRLPTGFGKTEIYFAPYLYQFIDGDFFASRMYMVEPLHALLEQMRKRAEKYSELVTPKPTVGEDHGEVLKPTYLYTSNITLTTVDTLVYGFLAKRTITWPSYGSVTGRYSMPAGLIMNAYTVIDEAHLIQDEIFLGPRILSKVVCSVVKSGGIVVLGTATMPKTVYELFERECGEGYIEELQADNYKVTGRKAVITRANNPITHEDSIKMIQPPSIVFVNTIERARKVYEELKKNLKSGTRLYLLHSLLKKEDRDKVIEGLDKAESKEEDVILVSTQAAEVGIDYNVFKRVYTEVSPIDSLIQRIGRVRNARDVQVTVFDVPSSNPYIEKVIENTSKILSETTEIQLDNMDQIRGLVDGVYTPDVISEMATKEQELYVDSLEYLHSLHLFSYPPEGVNVYLRPSYYITLYVLTKDEYNYVLSELKGVESDNEKCYDVLEKIQQYLLGKSIKYSISLVNDFRLNQLLNLLNGSGNIECKLGFNLAGCQELNVKASQEECKNATINKLANASSILLVVNDEVYEEGVGLKLPEVVPPPTEGKGKKKKGGRGGKTNAE